MIDQIETIEGSLIQHGPYNDRIYVMHLAPGNPDLLIARIDQLARSRGYGKIFAKIPAHCLQPFRTAGYLQEAQIPGYFCGGESCLFVAKFYQDRQQTSEDFSTLHGLVSQSSVNQASSAPTEQSFRVERCSPSDAQDLSQLYQRVFPTYPFPISDPSYLACVMERDVSYYGVRSGKIMVAAAAIEPDTSGQAAEMTDFATHPTYQGKGLASLLLQYLHKVIEKSRIKTTYTIARASSYSINRIFCKHGYTYAGLLINNTQISGRIQSMSVWYKQIASN